MLSLIQVTGRVVVKLRGGLDTVIATASSEGSLARFENTFASRSRERSRNISWCRPALRRKERVTRSPAMGSSAVIETSGSSSLVSAKSVSCVSSLVSQASYDCCRSERDSPRPPSIMTTATMAITTSTTFASGLFISARVSRGFNPRQRGMVSPREDEGLRDRGELTRWRRAAWRA